MTAGKGPGFKKRRPKAVKPESSQQFKPHIWRKDTDKWAVICRGCGKEVSMNELNAMDTRDERLEALGGTCDDEEG
jgi:hypothetical protein